MAPHDYPIDLRVDYPASSSRGWAALTILLIKLIAVIPHGIVLLFLGIAQMVVAFVAQVVVAFSGEYPAGMFAFVTGVLRWGTRVSAFVYSLTDKYPPFTLQPDDDYGVDLVAERPPRHNRLYAAFTVLVQVLAIAAVVWFVVWLLADPDSWLRGIGTESGAPEDNPIASFSPQSWASGGLLLRQIAAFPHLIVLMALGVVSVFIWLIVQWVILVKAVYPRGMFDLVAGIVRWQMRVSCYAFGLTDRYPPFTFEPSIAAPATTAPTEGAGPGQVPAGGTTEWAGTGQGSATGTTRWAGTGQWPAVAPPQWYPDPLGRHAYRYWDGVQWTPYVADNGVTGFDPVGGPGSPGQA